MTPSYLKLMGVMGIQMLLVEVTDICAQSFTFEFDSDHQAGVYEDANGIGSILDWSDSGDNPLELEESGSLFFEFEPSGSLISLDLEAGSQLNWNSPGLGDASSGFNSVGESISFAFGADVLIEEMDFEAITEGGADEFTLKIGNEPSIEYDWRDVQSGSVLPLSLKLEKDESLRLELSNGSFYLESLTISAIPEPGVAFGSFFGLLLVWRLRKVRSRTAPNCVPS